MSGNEPGRNAGEDRSADESRHEAGGGQAQPGLVAEKGAGLGSLLGGVKGLAGQTADELKETVEEGTSAAQGLLGQKG